MRLETMRTLHVAWEDIEDMLRYHLIHVLHRPDLAQLLADNEAEFDTNKSGIIVMIGGSTSEELQE